MQVNKWPLLLVKSNNSLLTLNTEIYENYSAVLQKQDGYYFLKQFLLTRIMINSAILMIESVYENKKSASLRYIGDWHSFFDSIGFLSE